ncbi:DUF4258 domain-containing protein [Candidatus Woesearchaeota archaeon]|nr:DUF4258 domain-containing protein [Candidatus Woesearchaeota archaeon]
MSDVYFEVKSCLGKNIRVTKSYWRKIIETKHRIIKGKEDIVKETLKSPIELRKSRKDPKVVLHYKKLNGKYCCVVTKSLNGEGFIITAYITDRVKIGEKYETD